MSNSTSVSSDALAAGNNYQLATGKWLVNAVLLDPGAEITLYDNPNTPSGKIILHAINASTSSLDIFYNIAVRADTGIIAVVAGTGNAWVFHGGA